MARREVEIKLPCYPEWPESDGYKVTVTRKGVELFAWQGIVGIKPVSLTWEQLMQAKAQVEEVKPRR